MDISENSKQIQVFLMVIIFGYFGVKIVYGLFFKFYPYKYYYRNITITTTQKSGEAATTENIALNAFIPGMWNNEMSDFITAIVLTSLILVFTYNVSSGIFTLDGTAHPAFVIGYLMGLLYPIFVSKYGNSVNEQITNYCNIRYAYIVIILFIMTFIISLNYTSTEINSTQNLSIYFLIMFLLIFGLLLSKKNSVNKEYVTYFNSRESGAATCPGPNRRVIQSSGDVINITPQFAAFIMLFLFHYNPSNIGNKFIYIFLYGLLLGIVVSGISYFGIEYFLVKMPEQEVTDNFDNFSSEGRELSTPSNIGNDYENGIKESYVQNMKLGKIDTEETSLTIITGIKRGLIFVVMAIFVFIIYRAVFNRT